MSVDPLRQELIEEGALAAMLVHSQTPPDDLFVWRKVSERVLDAFLALLAERGVIGFVSQLRADDRADGDSEGGEG